VQEEGKGKGKGCAFTMHEAPPSTDKSNQIKSESHHIKRCIHNQRREKREEENEKRKREREGNCHIPLIAGIS
jgi:hypothetical protein